MAWITIVIEGLMRKLQTILMMTMMVRCVVYIQSIERFVLKYLTNDKNTSNYISFICSYRVSNCFFSFSLKSLTKDISLVDNFRVSNQEFIL